MQASSLVDYPCHCDFTTKRFGGWQSILVDAPRYNACMAPNPNSSVPLRDVLEALASCAAAPFEKARPIPAAVNHSREFLDHEIERIFSKEWICVGREDEIPEFGDYLTARIADVPVLALRQENGEIHAFVNACAHRFACLVPGEKGSSRRFTCRYHGWTYDVSGQLVRAPHMEWDQSFRTEDHQLRPLQVATWEGFLYVTLNQSPDHVPQSVLKPFTDGVVGRYDMACYRTVIRESMTWNANWKNLVENFTESYHVPVAHGKTFARHDKSLDVYVCGEDSDYYGYHRAPQPLESGLGAAHPNNDRLEGEWRRMMIDFCVFPCHLVTLMPDYVWWITVQPDGTDRMNATWGVAMPPEVLADVPKDKRDKWLDDFRAYMDVANEEDRVLVEALHAGSASPILPTGAYHPLERNLWQFNRYLARMCCT